MLTAYLLLELILAVGGGGFMLLTVYLWWIHRKYSHLPGPPRDSFFLGNLPEINREKQNGVFMTEVFRRWHLAYGDNYVFFVLHKPIVFSVEQSTVRDLLISDEHPKDKLFYSVFHDVFGARFVGKGLVTEVDKDKWAKRRHVLEQAFHRTYLKSIIPAFNSSTDNLINALMEHTTAGTYVNIFDKLQLVTLDIIGQIAFGMNMNSLEKPGKFAEALMAGFRGSQKLLEDPLCMINPLQDRQFKKETIDACNYLRKAGNELLLERRQLRHSGAEVPNDLLTFIMKADAHTPIEAVDDIVTFFVAGTDTTTATLSFALREMGRRPDVMERLVDEIKDVVGAKEVIDFSDLANLTYTEMVLKETLRMYPAAVNHCRELQRDIDSGGYTLPKHSLVMISQYVSGRNADVIKQADEFIPERFEQGSDLRPTVYGYFPFLLGPRNCIGQHFAMIEMKMILAKLFQQFRYELHPEQSFDIEQKVTLCPKGGVRMKFHSITQSENQL